MKWIFSFFLLFCSVLFGQERLQYTVIKNSYTFSTYFEFISPNGYEGRVTKGSVAVRNCYKYYDAEGTYQGEGIGRLLSLGALKKWATDIDVYDARGHKIGLISGKVLTTAKAKFEFYDCAGDLVAVAYDGYNGTGFSVMRVGKIESLIGYLKMEKNGEVEVTIYDRECIGDERLLKIFSAFISDYQKSF